MSRPLKLLCILLIAAVAAGIGGIVANRYANSLPKLYQSVAVINVELPDGARSDLSGFSKAQQQDMEVKKTSSQLHSDKLLAKVSENSETLRTLRQNLTVDAVKDTQLIEVKLLAKTPESAAADLNEILVQFIKLKEQEILSQRNQALDALRAEYATNHEKLVALQGRFENVEPERVADLRDLITVHQGLEKVLQARINQAELTANTAEPAVEIVAPAQSPSQSAYPNVRLISGFSAAGAALVGFILGVIGFVVLGRKQGEPV
jgi:uncharacterized protein involved in exopolysaccharide biosynthesis